MITLKTHTQEEFEAQYITRRGKMRSIMMRQVIKILYEHSIENKKIDAAELARLVSSECRDIHKRVSSMNNLHGVKVLNKTGSNQKSSYKLVGFFEPEKRKRKRKAKKEQQPSFMFQLSNNQKLINNVFC